jgi:hypothetical protein
MVGRQDAPELHLISVGIIIVNCDFYLSQNLSYQRPRQYPCPMVRDGRHLSIGMFVESMAAFLSNFLKSEAKKQLFHSPGVDKPELAHPTTSSW